MDTTPKCVMLGIMLLGYYLHSAQSTNVDTHVQDRIRNGTEIERNSMPWLVDIDGDCTGVIIGSRHVLTVVHCHDTHKDIDTRQFVYIGTHEKEVQGTGQKIRIIKVEGLDQDGNSEPLPTTKWLLDIEVVTLESDIEFNDNVQKAILDSPSTSCRDCGGDCSEQNIFSATGWGKNGEVRSKLPLTATMQCTICSKKYLAGGKYDWQRRICVRSNIDPYNIATGGGDSGGPLTRENTNILVGILNAGNSPKPGKKRILYSVYTSVRDRFVQNWIQGIVPDLEIKGDYYSKVKSGKECQSDDTKLGTFSSVGECADACRQKGTCAYFIYGTGSKSGSCWWEYTNTADCSEGWENDSYDFYKITAEGCNFESGRAVGGSEKLVGNTETANLCLALVRQKEPLANGATWATNNKGCYAEFWASNIDTDICTGCQTCIFSDSCKLKDKYLSGYPNDTKMEFAFFTEALSKCKEVHECKGLTYVPASKTWALRAGSTPKQSPTGEISMLLSCLNQHEP